MYNAFTSINKKIACTTLCVVYTLLGWSCQNRGEADLSEPLSDEQISLNLSENGKTDPELLIGEWDLIKFAYTADGNKIKDVAAITKVASWVDVNGTGLPLNRILIKEGNPNEFFDTDEPLDGLLGPWCFWPYFLFYSISSNLISYRLESYPYMLMDTFTEEGYAVLNALRNTYSFVIKGNELIIHFIGVKNKNLLILKKR